MREIQRERKREREREREREICVPVIADSISCMPMLMVEVTRLPQSPPGRLLVC